MFSAYSSIGFIYVSVVYSKTRARVKKHVVSYVVCVCLRARARARVNFV